MPTYTIIINEHQCPVWAAKKLVRILESIKSGTFKYKIPESATPQQIEYLRKMQATIINQHQQL